MKQLVHWVTSCNMEDSKHLHAIYIYPLRVHKLANVWLIDDTSEFVNVERLNVERVKVPVTAEYSLHILFRVNERLFKCMYVY